jgi:preprotein translocase subunit SecG
MLVIIHVIISVLLLLSILVQHRASGLSATFGGSGSTNFVQRRGAEKVIYKASIWLSIAFFAISILRWFVFF